MLGRVDVLVTDVMTGRTTGLARTVRRALASLAKAEVPHCVIGATALAARGLPRMTRDLDVARKWLRRKARGSERYGIVVSSQAERLKPYAVDVKRPVNPVHWFLNEKDDVRSSYYLEDVATEFHVQGLELDWACVVWDADFRFTPGGWQYWSFRGNGWQRIHAAERRQYLKNAYRVLLTRARQGMVVVVPRGNREDPTRDPSYYDETFEYLSRTGMELITA